MSGSSSGERAGFTFVSFRSTRFAAFSRARSWRAISFWRFAKVALPLLAMMDSDKTLESYHVEATRQQHAPRLLDGWRDGAASTDEAREGAGCGAQASSRPARF